MTKTRGISLLLAASLLILPTAASADSSSECHWYIKKNDSHSQPPLPSEFSFIEDYGGYYLDRDHGDDCTCGCHDHDHHGHHHADEVFQSWGRETTHKYTEEQILNILNALGDISLGTVLRAKGIVAADSGDWIHFDFVPGQPEVRRGPADYTGRLCVIGADLDEDRIADLFGV